MAGLRAIAALIALVISVMMCSVECKKDLYDVVNVDKKTGSKLEVVVSKSYAVQRDGVNTTHYKLIIQSDDIKHFLLSNLSTIDIRVALRWQWEGMPEGSAD